MAYEKQTWNTGDIITADKLNHIEDGIGISYIIGNGDSDGAIVLDKTWNELRNIMLKFPVLFVKKTEEETQGLNTRIFYIDVVGCLVFTVTGGVYTVSLDGYDFTCSDPDDYPSWTDE